MKKLLTIVVIITTIITGTSCKKDFSPINAAVDQKQSNEQNAAVVHQNQTNEQNANASCQAPCPHAVAYYISVLSTTNNRTKMRLYINYYYVSDKNGKFDVSIKTQTQPQITIGRFTVDNVPPTNGYYGLVEKEFIFPINLSTYPRYSFWINGQSACNPACSLYIAYYPNLPL